MKNLCIILACFIIFTSIPDYTHADTMIMKLPFKDDRFKKTALQELLNKRHSQRNFQKRMVELDDLALILWAAVGIKFDALTGPSRVIPSAGATYPLELYLMVGKNSVEKLKEGLYHYRVQTHALELIQEGDARIKLAQACLGQTFIATAPLSLIITAYFDRTTYRYGKRGEQYVYMESGHACQNVYLAVVSLGLGTVEVGAFFDHDVKEVLGLNKDCIPLSIMPIGYPAE